MWTCTLQYTHHLCRFCFDVTSHWFPAHLSVISTCKCGNKYNYTLAGARSRHLVDGDAFLYSNSLEALIRVNANAIYWGTAEAMLLFADSNDLFQDAFSRESRERWHVNICTVPLEINYNHTCSPPTTSLILTPTAEGPNRQWHICCKTMNNVLYKNALYKS